MCSSLFGLATTQGQLRDFLFVFPLRFAQQPIRHGDNFARPIPAPALLGMFDCVRDDAALFVKFKDKQAAKLLVVARVASQPLGDLVHLFAGADAAVKRSHAFTLGLPAGFPPHDEPFFVAADAAALHDPLAKDDKLHVAHDRDSPPGHGRRP